MKKFLNTSTTKTDSKRRVRTSLGGCGYKSPASARAYRFNPLSGQGIHAEEQLNSCAAAKPKCAVTTEGHKKPRASASNRRCRLNQKPVLKKKNRPCIFYLLGKL